ncbi:ABC transporter ATP-binding protein [Leucobacter sp. PH1c]|uniref:ABC transporter ATP-binding protein n=1 Tax=Leucobacter sp. PH1c TaxID=1397278 RepID=UPI000469DB43|nr:ABC transporter ATP-binding protein [Leucobacter sp. PH1c]
MSELRLEGISVSYGPSPALRGLDLTIGPGEIVSLLGGNASGKSTTMKTVLGLKRPDAGRIIWDGEEIQSWPTARRVRAGIASVPEARRVFPDMSVEDNLLVGAHTRRDREIRATLAEVHDAFPRLRERRAQRAGTLSGGEQQMLAFGRALMSRPRLICMDEPTMGLAPIIVEQVLERIAELNRELGIAVLMVEQNAELALSIASRGYVLRTGEVVLSGAARELAANPAIQEAYLGRGLDGADRADGGTAPASGRSERNAA